MRVEDIFGLDYMRKGGLDKVFADFSYKITAQHMAAEQIRINKVHQSMREEGFSEESILLRTIMGGLLPKELDLSEKKQLMTDRSYPQFVLDQSILDMAEDVTIPDKMDLKWLENKQNGPRQFNWPNNLLRVNKVGTQIQAFAMKLDPNDGPRGGIQYTVFRLDLGSKQTNLHRPLGNPENPNDNLINSKNYDDKSKMFLQQLYVFMELSEMHAMTVKPGKTIGGKHSKDYFKNSLATTVTFLRVNWQREYDIKKRPVRGHIRLQAVGPKWSQESPRLIMPYKKKPILVETGRKIPKPKKGL